MASGPDVQINPNVDEENQPFINNQNNDGSGNNNNFDARDRSPFRFAINGNANEIRINLADIEVSPENQLRAMALCAMCLVGGLCSFWFFVSLAQLLALYTDWNSECDVPLRKWMVVNLSLPVLFGALYLGVLLLIGSIPPDRLSAERRRRYRRISQKVFSNRTEAVIYFFWMLQGFEWWSASKSCHDTAPILYYVALLALWISTIRMVAQWLLMCCLKIFHPAISNYLVRSGMAEGVDPQNAPRNGMGDAVNVRTLFAQYLRTLNPGVPDDVMASLERRVFRRDAESQSANVDAADCAICLLAFEEGDALRVLPCQHPFHSQCIDQWLGGHRTCPMCRVDVTR